MPSPLGHALAGVAAGWFVAPPASGSGPRRAGAMVVLYATVGMLPDVDLAFGSHSGPTHGLGVAVIAGAVMMLVVRRLRRPLSCEWFTLGVAVALTYATHMLLDWLGTDTSPPIGIMALWPFSRGYFESPLHVFMAISRRYWLPEFWTYNLRAVGREIVILVPLVALVVRARTPGASRETSSFER